MVALMIIETIRKHIERCGKTRYRIAQETGVAEALRVIKLLDELGKL